MLARLRQSALSVVENAILLETEPDLAPWAWYAGAYQQYHSLIWLLIELYQDPDLEEGPRILATADYVFGASWGLIYFDRSREILEALKKNLEAFLAAPGFSVLSEPTVRDYSQGSSLIGGVGIAVGGLEMHENVLRCDIDRFASGGPVTTNPEYSNSWWLMPYAAGDAISETDPSSFEAHIH
jgi:hypothetical protein